MNANHDISKEKADTADKLIQTKVGLREVDLKQTQSKLARVTEEKREAVQKNQQMHGKVRELKAKMQDHKCGKVQDVKKLVDWLTVALKSNKQVQDSLDKEKQLASDRYMTNSKLMEELSVVKRDKTKTEAKNLQSLLDKKKAAEKELEIMIRDLEGKMGKSTVTRSR